MGPGLYIHVPFCRARCGYCDFYSVAGAGDLHERTVGAILSEAAARGPAWTLGPFDSVFLGGGTPSHLGPALLLRLLDGLRERLPILPGAETTIEANPESASEELLQAALRGGANRLSLGVQSFDDGELRGLDRLHDAVDAAGAFARVRRAGFANASIDLIYGLPAAGDPPADGRLMPAGGAWEQTIRRGIGLEPDHLSCYLLTLEPGVPMARRGEKLSGDERARSEYDLARRLLREAGYGHYEISNWARSGMECRHNVNVWIGGTYLGLGPGAHGHEPGVRRANRPDLAAYLGAIESGVDAPHEIQRIDRTARAEERLMLGLRLRDGVSWQAVEEDLDPSAAARVRERASVWTAKGLMEDDGVRLRLSDEGLFVSNALIAELLGAI